MKSLSVDTKDSTSVVNAQERLQRGFIINDTNTINFQYEPRTFKYK